MTETEAAMAEMARWINDPASQLDVQALAVVLAQIAPKEPT